MPELCNVSGVRLLTGYPNNVFGVSTYLGNFIFQVYSNIYSKTSMQVEFGLIYG